MNAFVRKYGSLLIACSVYWATVAILTVLSVNNNQGHLIYPLDDTYIHMAIAKNTVLHHVWGVTRYSFTSSTSSPLWTSLLAISYYFFGVSETTPLILNVLFGTMTITAAYIILKNYINSEIGIFSALLAAIIFTPLPTLTITGMEHVLHILLSLSFLFLSSEILSKKQDPISKLPNYLIFLSPLVATIRYEGLFLIFIVCVLLLLRKRFFLSASIGLIAMLPILIYGGISMTHGWFFLPNSVLLKGQMPGLSLTGFINMARLAATKLISARPLLFVLIISISSLAVIYRRKDHSPEQVKYANTIFIGTLLLHILFASVGWFFRYEAYLIFLGVVVMSITTADLFSLRLIFKSPQKIKIYQPIGIFLLLIIVVQGIYRGFTALRDTPRATTNIYEQQYQMGIFIKRFYQGQAVALNDIGAVDFLADIHVLDFSGLGSLEPAKLKLLGVYTTSEKFKLAQDQGTVIAIVFAQPGGIPHQWEKEGQWQIPDNIVCASDTVTFFAITPSANNDLINNLRQFSKGLPREIKQLGLYME